jgi:ribonuclease HI
VVNEVIQIEAPHFCAGVVLTDGVVTCPAPIMNYMRQGHTGWTREQVLAYAEKKRWIVRLPKTHEVVIFTDGSCWPTNGGDGGWAFVMRWKDKVVEYYGSARKQTNNTMEITAILRAMQRLNPTKKRVHIFTDSQYAMNALTVWHFGWRLKGWVNSEGKPVSNKALIEEAVAEMGRHENLTIEWVRGHVGNTDNERADVLASKARKEQITNWNPKDWS